LVVCILLLGFFHPPAAEAADPVIAAAGDIACSTSSANYNGGNGTADASVVVRARGAAGDVAGCGDHRISGLGGRRMAEPEQEDAHHQASPKGCGRSSPAIRPRQNLTPRAMRNLLRTTEANRRRASPQAARHLAACGLASFAAMLEGWRES